MTQILCVGVQAIRIGGYYMQPPIVMTTSASVDWSGNVNCVLEISALTNEIPYSNAPEN